MEDMFVRDSAGNACRVTYLGSGPSGESVVLCLAYRDGILVGQYVADWDEEACDLGPVWRWVSASWPLSRIVEEGGIIPYCPMESH